VVTEYAAKAAEPAPAAPAPHVAKPAPAPAPAAPAPAAPKGKAAPAPAAPAPVKGRPGRKPKSLTAAAAPAAPAPAPAPKANSAAVEKWRNYVANLPENSRRFLELLEKQGQLTVHEAVEKLNLPGPKAMGGLTGAMARWAPKQGIEIPYEAREGADGTRYWVWKGVK
jgi:hypothetical protein